LKVKNTVGNTNVDPLGKVKLVINFEIIKVYWNPMLFLSKKMKINKSNISVNVLILNERSEIILKRIDSTFFPMMFTKCSSTNLLAASSFSKDKNPKPDRTD